MKKYLNLSWCLLLVLGFTSCDTEDDLLQTKSFGGHAFLSDRTISVFDTNENLSIDLFPAEGVTVESVEILHGGEVIETATVSGETATFSSSSFGAFEFEDEDGNILDTGSFPLTIRTTYSNGDVSEDSFSLNVNHAIELGEDNPTATNLDSLSTRVVEYSVSTHAATVDGVSLWLKKNSDGTYSDSGLTDLATKEGAVEISGTNYETLGLTVGDTLYYRFTATSGSLTDSASSFIAINNKEFAVSNEGTISSDLTMNQYNLATGEVSADGHESGEIAFIDPTGFTVINDVNINFVPVLEDYFDTIGEGVINAREAFINGGTPLQTFTDLSNGDMFAYSAVRDIMDEEGAITGTETVYGILKIGTVSSTTIDGETVVAMEVVNLEGN